MSFPPPAVSWSLPPPPTSVLAPLPSDNMSSPSPPTSSAAATSTYVFVLPLAKRYSSIRRLPSVPFSTVMRSSVPAIRITRLLPDTLKRSMSHVMPHQKRRHHSHPTRRHSWDAGPGLCPGHPRVQTYRHRCRYCRPAYRLRCHRSECRRPHFR